MVSVADLNQNYGKTCVTGRTRSTPTTTRSSFLLNVRCPTACFSTSITPTAIRSTTDRRGTMVPPRPMVRRAGEGYTTDQTLPGLDRGDSIFDIRHRLVINYVWQLPGQNLKGAAGAIAGGWNLNGIWSFQSGAHWEPYTSATTKPFGYDPDGSCTVADVNTEPALTLGATSI
jgi:hypothetical protein